MNMATSIVAALAISLVAGNLSAQPNETTSAAGTPYDYFRLGEICASLTDLEYHTVTAKIAKQTLENHRSLMEKLGVRAESLAAFDRVSSLVLELPFQKQPDFNQWSKEDQEKWSGGIALRSALSASVKADMQKAPENEYFYWLGFNSLTISWIVPRDLEVGLTIQESSLKQSLVDFEWLRDNKLTETLLGDSAAQVKAIADMKAKFDDPLEGLSKDDLLNLYRNAQLIRNAAKAKKLVR